MAVGVVDMAASTSERRHIHPKYLDVKINISFKTEP
jgi:hypothetical protein